jgi:hypothetical protein
MRIRRNKNTLSTVPGDFKARYFLKIVWGILYTGLERAISNFKFSVSSNKNCSLLYGEYAKRRKKYYN